MRCKPYKISFEINHFLKLSLATGIIIAFWITIAVVGRIIPHLPNATPLCALSVLSGYVFRKNWALFITLISLCLSDIILGVMQHNPIFGSWTLFTYTGFLFVTLFAPENLPEIKKYSVGIYLILSTIGYWLWTNLGTWIGTDFYQHTLQGLITCFIAGLPFLRNTLLGTIVYFLLFLWAIRHCEWSAAIQKKFSVILYSN